MFEENLKNLKGMTFESWGRTFSEGDFTTMNNLCWTIDWIHADQQRMKETTQFKDRILPGLALLAMIAGFMFTTKIYQAITDMGVVIIAMLTVEDIKFISPVYPGDTLHSELEITDTFLTSKENHGIIKIKDMTYKHTGEFVCQMTRVFLVKNI